MEGSAEITGGQGFVLTKDPEKQCKGPCARVLPLGRFHKAHGTVDGHAGKCVECVTRAKALRKAKRRLNFGQGI